YRVIAAHHFVVGHAAIGEHHGAPSLHAYAVPNGQARTQHHGIEEVAFKPDVLRHRAVIERAGQRRDEVDMPGGAALEKAASRNLDFDFKLHYHCTPPKPDKGSLSEILTPHGAGAPKDLQATVC